MPVERVEMWDGEDWSVRAVTGSAAAAAYRCPGCDHEIRPATPHLVVWPIRDGLDARRHWHTACWRGRHRRVRARRR
ncbi:MAG: hypothetical protein H0W56_03515 [Acidothermales bacterium]|nr:hypothetical protein [Acidothermales bacterium]